MHFNFKCFLIIVENVILTPLCEMRLTGCNKHMPSCYEENYAGCNQEYTLLLGRKKSIIEQF